MIQLVLFIGALIMTGAMIVFTLSKKPHAIFASMVAAATALSYLVMLDGSLALSSELGEIHYTRWLFYILSCSLLMVTMIKLLRIPRQNMFPVLFYNGLVMLSGALAAAVSGFNGIVIFIFGSTFFALQLWHLTKGSDSCEARFAWRYILTGWTLFPVVFLIAPEGLGIIGVGTSLILYLILDIYTKLLFYIELNALDSTVHKGVRS